MAGEQMPSQSERESTPCCTGYWKGAVEGPWRICSECGAREGSAGPLFEIADLGIDLGPGAMCSGARNDARLAIQAGVRAEPTPDREKGMWRKRGDTLLSECIYLMEQMFMESLNGALCQFEDGDHHSEGCDRCRGLWADLTALMERYDAGERE